MASSTDTFRHPQLGSIQYAVTQGSLPLGRFFNLPYGRIPKRFARSELRTRLTDEESDEPYVATQAGPSSVQPRGSAKMDAKGLQLPTEQIKDDEGEWQSETNCLQLSISIPKSSIDRGPAGANDKLLPVLLFLHGGAFFLGSGDRSYYDPCTLLAQAIESDRPMIYVSANYRLGAHGFFHSTARDGQAIPENNGLADQVILFRWIKENIAGFGGDPDNVTLMGQSAGAESVSLHNLVKSNAITKPYRRSIMLSGSPMCMPAKTKEEHEENFRLKAKEMGMRIEGRSSEDLVKEIQDGGKEWEDKLRGLALVGAPCSQSEIMPYETPSMAILRGDTEAHNKSKVDGSKFGRWVEEQIVSSCGYDGGISYGMIKTNDKRKDHAKAFIGIIHDVLDRQGKAEQAEELLELYGIESANMNDDEALLAICQFESDVGFFSPTLAEAEGAGQGETTKTILQMFDLGNPFKGLLPVDQYATHTWDVVALLGAFESRLQASQRDVIRDWRSKIIHFVHSGSQAAGLPEWQSHNGKALLINDKGCRAVNNTEIYGEATRVGQLRNIAKKVDEVWGQDILWNDVCRRFLMKGE